MGTDAETDCPWDLLPLEAYWNDTSTEPQRASRYFSASELDGLEVPLRPWLIQDLIPSGTVTLLGGDGGTGKSLLALQLATAVASGDTWLGMDVASGSAIFISAEDDREEIHRRLVQIAKGRQLDFNQLSRLSLRSLVGEDALLAESEGSNGGMRPSALLAELDALSQELSPSLIVLDTLADMFPGNENDRKQVRQFIGLLRGLALRHQCAVVVLAHPSLSGLTSGSGTSGSTAWSNSARSRLYLSRVFERDYEPNPDARILEVKKINYAQKGTQIALIWKHGQFVPEDEETATDRMVATAKAKRVFLKLLDVYTQQGRRVNGNSGANYAPRAFSDHPDSEGCTKRALRSAMEALLSEGTLQVCVDGPMSRRSHFLARAD
jgi:RecA-family ATPase